METTDKQLATSATEVSEFIKQHLQEIVINEEWSELCSYPPSMIFSIKKLKNCPIKF